MTWCREGQMDPFAPHLGEVSDKGDYILWVVSSVFRTFEFNSSINLMACRLLDCSSNSILRVLGAPW